MGDINLWTTGAPLMALGLAAIVGWVAYSRSMPLDKWFVKTRDRRVLLTLVKVAAGTAVAVLLCMPAWSEVGSAKTSVQDSAILSIALSIACLVALLECMQVRQADGIDEDRKVLEGAAASAICERDAAKAEEFFYDARGTVGKTACTREMACCCFDIISSGDSTSNALSSAARIQLFFFFFPFFSYKYFYYKNSRLKIF